MAKTLRVSSFKEASGAIQEVANEVNRLRGVVDPDLLSDLEDRIRGLYTLARGADTATLAQLRNDLTEVSTQLEELKQQFEDAFQEGNVTIPWLDD